MINTTCITDDRRVLFSGTNNHGQLGLSHQNQVDIEKIKEVSGNKIWDSRFRSMENHNGEQCIGGRIPFSENRDSPNRMTFEKSLHPKASSICDDLTDMFAPGKHQKLRAPSSFTRIERLLICVSNSEPFLSNKTTEKNSDKQSIEALASSIQSMKMRLSQFYDIDMVISTANNFSLRMMIRHNMSESNFELFKDYFEYALSYLKLNKYEKNFNIFNGSKPEIFSKLEQGYIHHERVIEYFGLIKQDVDQYNEFGFDQDWAKFSRKTRAVSQWLMHSTNDLYETKINKCKTLISPGQYLKEANDTLESGIIQMNGLIRQSTTDYPADVLYLSHKRYAEKNMETNELLVYYKIELEV